MGEYGKYHTCMLTVSLLTCSHLAQSNDLHISIYYMSDTGHFKPKIHSTKIRNDNPQVNRQSSNHFNNFYFNYANCSDVQFQKLSYVFL